MTPGKRYDAGTWGSTVIVDGGAKIDNDMVIARDDVPIIRIEFFSPWRLKKIMGFFIWFDGYDDIDPRPYVEELLAAYKFKSIKECNDKMQKTAFSKDEKEAIADMLCEWADKAMEMRRNSKGLKKWIIGRHLNKFANDMKNNNAKLAEKKLFILGGMDC